MIISVFFHLSTISTIQKHSFCCQNYSKIPFMPSKPAPKLFTKFKIYIFFFLSLQNNKQFHHYFFHFFLLTKHHYNTIPIHLFFTTVINNLFVLKNCIKTVGSSVLTKPEKYTFSADFPSFSAFFPPTVYHLYTKILPFCTVAKVQQTRTLWARFGPF